MNKKLTERLRPIGQDYYEVLSGWIKDNWDRPIENPLNEYLTYGTNLSDELNRIYQDYENDLDTQTEIDKYFECITKSAENHQVIPEYTGRGGYHGGGRAKTGIKRQTLNISGQPEEIDALKQKAKDAGMSLSRYIFEVVLKK